MVITESVAKPMPLLENYNITESKRRECKQANSVNLEGKIDLQLMILFDGQCSSTSTSTGTSKK